MFYWGSMLDRLESWLSFFCQGQIRHQTQSFPQPCYAETSAKHWWQQAPKAAVLCQRHPLRNQSGLRTKAQKKTWTTHHLPTLLRLLLL